MNIHTRPAESSATAKCVVQPSTVRGLLAQRAVEWRKEIPNLARGLAKLAAPFRWQFGIIFSFNILIASWETVQPFILAWGVDTFGENAPYIKIVAIIIVPVLVISMPHGILLPFLRDLYAVSFVKPRFEKHLGLLCLAHNRAPGYCEQAELVGKKAPIAQEGRLVAYQLIEMLLRDPAFALRGLFVIGILLFKSPLLVGLLLAGMLADLGITLLMDARLVRPYAKQNEHRFRIRGMEYQILDADSGMSRIARYVHTSTCESAWDDYVEATRFVEVRRLVYQLPIREGISLTVRVGIMVLVGWWVHIGNVSIGDYILFTQLAGRANDPLYVFLGMQQQIMTTREALRRLGLLLNIDFGIARPEPA